SLMRDVYVALGEPIADGSNQWALRIYVKPLIRWIWLGAIIMALGGLISMLDKRYRIKKIKAPLLVTGSLATYGVNEVAIEQAISVSTMSTLKEK
ncbi:cytochrome c-type biogenesis CcmF C-terminal domain-containing protein, partial [Psychrobacter pacificensis]